MRTIILVGTLIALLGSAVVHAQWFGRRYQIEQNDPPATELIAARWRFSTNGRIRHRGWSHNYPSSDRNLNQFISDATRIDVDPMSYRIVELGSEEIFDHPFTYVSEPGEMELTEQEVDNLREYVRRGGFILIDDFDGSVQLGQLQSQMRRAFPERNLVPLTIEHPIFDLVFDVEDLKGMAPYVPGGDPQYLGFMNDRNHVAIVACYNNDLANFWDWIDEARYPLRPATDAFRMGINFVEYAMTH